MKFIPINNQNYQVVVIGMGYVGLTYSLHINECGFDVIGVEKDQLIKEKINNNRLPFFEEGLDGFLSRSITQGLLKVYDPDEFSIKQSELPKIFIITVGTPVKDHNLNEHPLRDVFSFLQKVSSKKDKIVLRSTVPIGLTRSLCESLRFPMMYSFAPERTIEGKAMFELANLPQVFGSNCDESKAFFRDFFSKISSEVLELSNSESAELVKLTSNVYRDVVFGFSNEISFLAHKNSLNVKEIINACNYKYSRCEISSSGPVAGPCLSKDSYILSKSIESEKIGSIIMTARKFNENYVIQVLDELLDNVKKVAILGLSFKGVPPTSDTRDSYAITLIQHLKNHEVSLSAFDPMVFDEIFDEHEIQRESSLENAFKGKDLIIIQNNNPIFQRMDINRFSSLTNKDSKILDLWSLHNGENISHSNYIGL